MTATTVTTGAYSARNAHRSCAMSNAARYGSAALANGYGYGHHGEGEGVQPRWLTLLNAAKDVLRYKSP